MTPALDPDPVKNGIVTPLESTDRPTDFGPISPPIESRALLIPDRDENEYDLARFSPSSDLSAFFGGMIDVAYMVRHCFGRRLQLFKAPLFDLVAASSVLAHSLAEFLGENL